MGFGILVLIFFIVMFFKNKKEIEEEIKRIKEEKEKNNEIKNVNIDPYEKYRPKQKKYNNLKVKNLFTYNELRLYNELKYFLQNKDVILLSKVRLADFIGMTKYSSYSDYMVTFNKINRKHIDFIIADTKGNIKLLIELDGYSHNYKDTIESDKLKNELFEELQIPLIRFKNNSYHDFNIIKNYL